MSEGTGNEQTKTRDERIKELQDNCDHEDKYASVGNAVLQSGTSATIFPILFCKLCGTTFMRKFDLKGMPTASGILPAFPGGKKN